MITAQDFCDVINKNIVLIPSADELKFATYVMDDDTGEEFVEFNVYSFCSDSMVYICRLNWGNFFTDIKDEFEAVCLNDYWIGDCDCKCPNLNNFYESVSSSGKDFMNELLKLDPDDKVFEEFCMCTLNSIYTELLEKVESNVALAYSFWMNIFRVTDRHTSVRDDVSKIVLEVEWNI